ncbi:MAG TPA: saccharopine dehydrogenase NADP-binding domain-containing protein [Chloroflexota bacterium]|jgi:saccharopine dehydrogenase (NAD+, L-lysine-forming)
MGTGRWLIYGANGYTGRLIAQHAWRLGLRPVLAGRRPEVIRPLAESLGLEFRVFDLHHSRALDEALSAVAAIVLAAGPFSATSRLVVDACLRTGRAYLDITGEFAVFEAILGRDAEARRRATVLLPGVGFDVVPSDCLAASLHAALPEATHLELAFHGGGRPSRGTLLTALEGARDGGAIRVNGDIRREALYARVREIPFPNGRRVGVSIPWGDLSTAYQSTGIPNIVIYRAVPHATLKWLPLLRVVTAAVGVPLIHATLRRLVERLTRDQAPPGSEPGQLWGRVTSATGRSIEGTLTTPQAYVLTARTAVECAERVAAGRLEPGAHTPSQAFGTDFITQFEGCDLRIQV